jgi:hypothetical protein
MMEGSMATAKRRMVLPFALAVGAIGLMVMTSIAGASHPRPQGATPLRAPLVPAFKQCAAPNRTHGPPLAFPSCHPPAPGSNFVTVGTPDADGAPAKSHGFVNVAVRAVSGAPSDQSEIVITSRITDVRCKAGTSTCGNANTTGGADYTGELQANATIRITDHYNATSPGGGPDAATVVDIPFPINIPCVNTSDPEVGSLCDVAFAPQPLSPVNDTWFNGKRVVIEMSKFEVSDGGSDGVVSTTPNTLFLRQGIFVP